MGNYKMCNILKGTGRRIKRASGGGGVVFSEYRTGYLRPLNVQGQPQVIQCICEFWQPCILKTPGVQICDSGILENICRKSPDRCAVREWKGLGARLSIPIIKPVVRCLKYVYIIYGKQEL